MRNRRSRKNELHIETEAAKRIESIISMQKELSKKVAVYEDRLKKGELCWGQVGDLGHYVELLEEMLGKRG